jgi:hypothetical protein
MLVRFAHAADFDCFLVAGRYTLVDQVALRELLPLCRERGIAVIVGGVYNSGILADPRPSATFDYAPALPELVERAQRLEAICRRHGVPLKASSTAFPLAHPAVPSLLGGARSPTDLDEDVALLRTPLPPEHWNDLRRERLVPEEGPDTLRVDAHVHIWGPRELLRYAWMTTRLARARRRRPGLRSARADARAAGGARHRRERCWSSGSWSTTSRSRRL